MHSEPWPSRAAGGSSSSAMRAFSGAAYFPTSAAANRGVMYCEIPTEARLIFSKPEPTEFAWVIFSANLNGYEIFVVQLVDIQHLCGDRSHLRRFLLSTN